jgi:predicted RNase H-like nuclease
MSKTASERIVDTLEFFPHNYQLPQLSSTDRLLMAAKDMTDALQNPHPEVPFARVGDDTILKLADLRQFSNSNYDKPRHPRLKLCLLQSYNSHDLLNHNIKS